MKWTTQQKAQRQTVQVAYQHCIGLKAFPSHLESMDVTMGRWILGAQKSVSTGLHWMLPFTGSNDLDMKDVDM